MKEKIIELIHSYGPIKPTELIVKISNWKDENPDKHSDEWKFHDVIQELIKNGDIIEVCYTLPYMDYREKSLYFPKGTEIQITK